jgi:choline dehydrogenase-like flavoprotein
MAQDSGEAFDHDVAIVGGGPAGSSAAVFTARYGLDTVVFDRGRSSIQQCAHLENYLGFPGGIDIRTFYDLMHSHAEGAGCEIVSDLVQSVERADERGFVVERQSGEAVTARRVIAATRYGGEYLRGLDSEDAMFETHEYDGQTEEFFDKSYAEEDGSTPVEGLFVASPYGSTSPQASMAAGHGARVGVAVVEAERRGRGYPDGVADYYDWMRRERERDEEWSDPDRWREFLESQFPEDDGLSAERRDELLEREVDRRLDTYISEETAQRRGRDGQRRLLDHIDDDLVVEAARKIEAERSSSDS